MINNHYINKVLGIPTRHVEQRFGQGVRLGRHSMKQEITIYYFNVENHIRTNGLRGNVIILSWSV